MTAVNRMGATFRISLMTGKEPAGNTDKGRCGVDEFGNVNSKKVLRRTVAVVLAAVAATAGLMTGPLVPAAQAYDQNNCSAGMRADVDQFKVDTGGSGDVDFGDDAHLGGVPQGTAVVCWGSGGSSVSLTGKLFWDSFDPGCADADVTVFRNDGVGVSFQDYSEICSNGGLKSRVVEHSMFSNARNLSRIRIRLFRRDLQDARTLVISVSKSFGD